MRRGLAVLTIFMALFVSAFLGAGSAGAASSGVSFTAQLDGRNVTSLSSNDPLALDAGQPLQVVVAVRNGTDRPVTVAAARIRGTVMGLTFFNYDTQIGLRVAPGATERSRFSIGLADLSGQAVGLLPARVSLLDANSNELASRSFTVDVDGDLTSIYGVFGLAIAALTALWLVSLIVRLVRKSLPGNRWTRAVQFAVAGFGVGLTLTFTVSALRLLAPDAGVWLPFVLGAGAVGFVLGYLTPGPQVGGDDDEDFAAARLSRQDAQVGARQPQPAVAGPQPWQGEIERRPLGAPPTAAPDELPAGSPGDDRDTVQGSVLQRHFPQQSGADDDPRR